MDVTILGCAAGAPLCGNPASGYLVTSGSTRIWVDCGPGTFAALCDRLAGEDLAPRDVDAVVVSHIHIDHCTDLFALYAWMAYGPSGNVPIPVFVPDGAAAHLAAFARAGADHLFHTVFEMRTVAAGDEAELGGVTLRFGDASHSVPALLTRIEAEGRSLVYSGDTGPTDALAGLADGVDVLLCEATFSGPRDEGEWPYHLTAGEAGAAGAEAGAGRLILTHLGFSLDPAASKTEAATRYPGEVLVARPGMHVAV